MKKHGATHLGGGLQANNPSFTKRYTKRHKANKIAKKSRKGNR